ncbi:MAG: glycosyltransferase family 39 protein [Pyrinomonadaceae bacterium]
MDKILALLAFIIAAGIIALTFPDGNAAVVVATILSVITLLLLRYFYPKEKLLLSRLFITAMFARLVFGALVHFYELRERFSADSTTYHEAGRRRMEEWFGISSYVDDQLLIRFTENIGWGMSYFVAGLYSVVGADILTAQFVCSVIGAATVPLVYICVKRIFNNHRASLTAALLVGFYPAFIIWTSQLLKDGLIVFCLVLAMTMILSLREKFNYGAAITLIITLVAIQSLRFYIFYMISAAMVGAFLVGTGKSNQSIVRNLVVLTVLGVGLTYLGAAGNASSEIAKYASLENIERSRAGAARADSGFGQDSDVSTTGGALSAIPVGFVYVMFAPFPWDLFNTTYLITAPDMIIWWASIPFLIIGLLYSIKNNLRKSLGILIFSMMLALAYSLFQGNIGTAYRQRIQIQVFLFMFVGVGWTLVQEKRENKKLIRDVENRRFNERLRRNSVTSAVGEKVY